MIYVKSALAGLLAAVIGFVIWHVGLFVVLVVMVTRDVARTPGSGGLGAASVTDYYLPFGALAVFALGAGWTLRRLRTATR